MRLPGEIKMQRIYVNAGNYQSTINNVMRQLPGASLRQSGGRYIVSCGDDDVVEIVTFTQAATFVDGSGGLVCTSIGPARVSA